MSQSLLVISSVLNEEHTLAFTYIMHNHLPDICKSDRYHQIELDICHRHRLLACPTATVLPRSIP